MKLSKLLVSCVAVGALAAACTTAAFAADGVTAKYENGTVTLSDYADYVGKVNGDLTLLVLSADESVTSENANTIIKQIDQFAKTETTKSVNVGTLENGTYYVRLGGAEADDVNVNGFVATTFTVGSDNPWAGSTRKIGDVGGDGEVDLRDLDPIVKYVGNLNDLKGESLQAADTNDDREVDLRDLDPIVKYVGNLASSVDGVKTVADKSQYVPE